MLQDRRELILSTILRLNLWIFKALAALPEYYNQDHSRGKAAYMLVVIFRALRKLEDCLRSFCVLDWEAVLAHFAELTPAGGRGGCAGRWGR